MKQISRQAYEDPGFAGRRLELQKLILQPLGALRLYTPDPSSGAETPSVHSYNSAYRTRLQYYHLCLLTGKDVCDANHYFTTHEDLVSHWWNHPRNEPDWKMLPLTRIYYECRKVLSSASLNRIESLMREFRGYISLGGTENHIINRVAITLLCDAALGIEDNKTRQAAEVYERWIWQRGHRGYMEYNSPTYHSHCVQPLLLVYDLIRNEKWKNMAASALDQIMAMIAIQSLKGSRGGPWHRATSPREPKDSRSDVAYTASYVYFGNCPRPPSLDSAAWITTHYRVPGIIYRMALERESLGHYEIRQRVDTVAPTLDAYYFITPRYLLGSFQNAKPFVCHYYGSTNISNLHPWELSFSDPTKVMGVWRDLEKVENYENTNTALMQYQGVLFFRGGWLDYNGNLGPAREETAGNKQFFFYNIDTENGSVYVAIIFFSEQQNGILEVCLSEEVSSWSEFVRKIKEARTTCNKSQGCISHTNLNGDVITYESGKAKVNDKVFPLENYPLCASPTVHSEWDSGKFLLTHHKEELLLDFTNPSVFSGRGLAATYYYDPGFQNVAFTRQDQTIDYSWKKRLPVITPIKGFSVRWTGTFLASYTGCHQLILKTVGKASLWIDGKSVVSVDSDTRNRGLEPMERTGIALLREGRQHDIKIEYSQTGEEAVIVCSISTPFLPRQTLGLLSELASGLSQVSDLQIGIQQNLQTGQTPVLAL